MISLSNGSVCVYFGMNLIYYLVYFLQLELKMVLNLKREKIKGVVFDGPRACGLLLGPGARLSLCIK